MKKYLAIVAVVLALGNHQAVFADSAVDWSAASATGLQLADGANLALPQGDWVALVALNTGVTETDVQTAFAAGNMALVLSDLKIYATTTIGTGTSTDGSFTLTSTSGDNSFLGLQIYYAAANTADPASATQFGLWTDLGNNAWKFADTTAVPPSNKTTTEMDNVDHSVLGSIVAASADLNTKTQFTFAGQLELVPSQIPEPASFVLVGLSLAGAVGFVRRQRS